MAQNFENNLFSDLAPLLVLFGDETTKQFLSTATGLGDDILVGIAPIGVLTTMVCAIRIAGGKLLRSFIGRARESPDDEEKEILSSTSSNVREIYDGDRVVRQGGESKTIELIVRTRPYAEAGIVEILSLAQAVSSKIYAVAPKSRPKTKNEESNQDDEYEDIDKLEGELKTKAPNLLLNTPMAIPNPRDVWICVVCGLVVQLAVFTINALAVYYWQWLRTGTVVSSYGYPTWAAGTVSLTVGMSLCAHVVEASTEKIEVVPKDLILDLVRWQKPIPGLNLPAYAIGVSKKGDHSIRISRRISNPDRSSKSTRTGILMYITWAGIFLTLSGFICQNIGTRELHWSAGVLQLMATLILTTLRSWLRLHVGGDALVEAKPLRDGYGASDLACHLHGCTHFKPGTILYYLDEQPPESLSKPPQDVLQAKDMVAMGTIDSQNQLSEFEADSTEIVSTAQRLCTAIGEIASVIAEKGPDIFWYQDVEISGVGRLLEAEYQKEPLSRSIHKLQFMARTKPWQIVNEWEVKALLSITMNHHLSQWDLQDHGEKHNAPLEKFRNFVGKAQEKDIHTKTAEFRKWFPSLSTLFRSPDGEFIDKDFLKDHLDLNTYTLGKTDFDLDYKSILHPGEVGFFVPSYPNSLLQAIAQQFIASFMICLLSSETSKARARQSLTESTTRVLIGGDDKDKPSYYLSPGEYVYANDYVDRIVRILVKNQLVKDEGDAAIVVIPALLVNGCQIPNPEAGVLELAKEKARRIEEEWDREFEEGLLSDSD